LPDLLKLVGGVRTAYQLLYSRDDVPPYALFEGIQVQCYRWPRPGTRGTTWSEAADLRPRGIGQTRTSDQPLKMARNPPKPRTITADCPLPH
jgi:hypothetical protein